MVLQIASWYKFFVRRMDGLTKTSKRQLETRPTITAKTLGLTHLALHKDGDMLCLERQSEALPPELKV